VPSAILLLIALLVYVYYFRKTKAKTEEVELPNDFDAIGSQVN